MTYCDVKIIALESERGHKELREALQNNYVITCQWQEPYFDAPQWGGADSLCGVLWNNYVALTRYVPVEQGDR